MVALADWFRLAGIVTVVPAGGPPSVVERVTGGPIRGTWWAHPQAHAIFDAVQVLAEHPDSLHLKPVAGKQGFIHRRLWPALAGVVSSAEWRGVQLSRLAPEARAVLTRVEAGECPSGVPRREREGLESAVLVRSEERHTESGRHEITLSRWSDWASGIEALPYRLALAELDDACAPARFGPARRLTGKRPDFAAE